MNKKLINGFKFILFLAVGIGLMYLTYKQSEKDYLAKCDASLEICDFSQYVIDSFRKVNYLWVFLSVAVYMFSNILRTLRWQQLLESIGYSPLFRNVFGATMIGYFVNLGLPRAGEVAKVVSLSSTEKIPIEKNFGTAVLDRVVDLICMLLIVLFAVCFEYDTIVGFLSEKIQPEKLILLRNVMIGGLILGVGFLFLWSKIRTFSFFKKIDALLIGFLDGLKSIFTLKKPFLFILYTLGIWIAYFLMTYFMFDAFLPTSGLGLSAGLVVFVFGSLGFIFPSPGGIGSYHIAIIAALSIYGVSDGWSFATVSLLTFNIFANIPFGILAIILLPYLNKNYIPSVTES